MAKITVIYASDYGSTKRMAEAVAEGARSVDGTEVQVQEAEHTTIEDLLSSDGIVIGTPVHMGSPDWRIKKFIDTVCSGAWMKDSLVGKVGAVFASGSGYGGAGAGCELTMLGLLNNIAEQGMIIVPLPKSTPGYSAAGLQWGPYGRAHDENLNPKGLSDDQLVAAKHHGRHVARAAAALKGAKIFG